MNGIQKCPHCNTVFSTSDGICPHCKKSTVEEEPAPQVPEKPTYTPANVLETKNTATVEEMVQAAQQAQAAEEAKNPPKASRTRIGITDDETGMYWVWWTIGALVTGAMWVLSMAMEENYFLEWQCIAMALGFLPFIIYGIVLFCRRRKGILWKLCYFAELVLVLIALSGEVYVGSIFGTIYMLEGIAGAIILWIAIKS